MSAILQPPAPRLWKPRASSVGNYMSCLWRAANDRFAVERPGQGWAPAPQEDTSYADHGTCCHFVLQDGTGSLFPGREPTDEEVLEAAEHFYDPNDGEVAQDLAESRAADAFLRGDSRAWQPTKAQWESGAKLFGGNRQTHLDAVRRVATLAAERMPKAPDGKPWVAESLWETSYLTGHTDFTSQCRRMGGDLKSTARPPDGGEIKDEHLAQVTGYYLMTGIPLWWVLYVDSQAARWATLVWVDFTRPDRQFYAEQLKSFCEMLMSSLLEQVAYPRVGKHCEKSWCPYELNCAAKIRPPKGTYYDAVAAKRLIGRIKSPFDPA